MEFARRYDMRNISRKSFLETVQKLDAEAVAAFGGAQVDRQYSSDGTDTIVTWVPRKSINVDMAPLATALAATVKQINRKQSMAQVTGAKALGNMFRGHLADIKAQIDKAGQDMNVAMSDLKDTATQATEMVKQVQAETMDLKASLGLHSNNPPEDVDGA